MFGIKINKSHKIKGWAGGVYGFHAEKGSHSITRKSVDKKTIKRERKKLKNQGYNIYDLGI